MSITQVDVVSDDGTFVAIPLREANVGYFFKDIEGLDPVKADISTAAFGATDGEQEQSSRRGSRNIVMHLGFDPDFAVDTVRSLRRALYRRLMPKTAIKLRFTLDDANIVQIDGRVEEFGSPLFTREPGADVSVICVKPDFYDLDNIEVAGNTTDGATEIPFTYDGDVGTGMIFRLFPNRAVGGFTIYHHGSGNATQAMEFAYPMMAGDVLEINTNAREKGAYINHLGVRSSILYGVSPMADWIQLVPNTNYIRVAASGAAIPYTITYKTKYGGL